MTTQALRVGRLQVTVFAILVLACSSCKDKGAGDEHARAANGQGHTEGGKQHEEGVVELSPEAAAQAKIKTRPAEERPISAVMTTTGRVDFNEDRLAHVSPRVSGRVHKVLVVLGEQVREGVTLAVIDSLELGQARSEYLNARSQLDLAKETLKREEGLQADKITSEQSVLEARSAHQRALANYQTARERLRLLGLTNKQIDSVRYEDPAASLFPLRASIDGTVVEKHVSMGEAVTPEKSLYTIADLSRVWIWIDVFERDLARVHLGDDVAVRVDAQPDRVFEGKVGYIRDQIDTDSRTARARIDVDNREMRLKPGMFASVTITDPHHVETSAPQQKVVAVPATAVQRDGDTSIAFIQTGEYRYERRVLRLGTRTDAYVQVLDGLKAGDRVVVEGTFLLKSEAAKEEMGGGHSH